MILDWIVFTLPLLSVSAGAIIFFCPAIKLLARFIEWIIDL